MRQLKFFLSQRGGPRGVDFLEFLGKAKGFCKSIGLSKKQCKNPLFKNKGTLLRLLNSDFETFRVR